MYTLLFIEIEIEKKKLMVTFVYTKKKNRSNKFAFKNKEGGWWGFEFDTFQYFFLIYCEISKSIFYEINYNVFHGC